MPPVATPTRRHGVSHSQRIALRQYSRDNPELTQSQLRLWFESQFQIPITQPTISASLSNRFDWLEDNNALNQSSKRKSRQKWPDVEEAVVEWIEQRGEDAPRLTGEMIKEQAGIFWRNLGHHEHTQEVPIFSNGWLQGFHHRHNIRPGDKARPPVINDPVQAQTQMVAIQAMARNYPPEDVYTCDETGLHYKFTPEANLGTVNKAKMTALFCCNADGSDKLSTWFVGTSDEPKSFTRSHVQVSSLNCTYRSNEKAAFTVRLVEEWLHWFDDQMDGRRVLLLMDTLGAHTLALATVASSKKPLQNTTVAWLPTTTELKTQPMVEGIIPLFKALYRKTWLSYMINEYETGRNPVRTMNVLKAIRWAIQTWDAITPRAIQNSWYRSTILHGPKSDSFWRLDDRPSLQGEMYQLQQRKRIARAIPMEEFLSPAHELVKDAVDGQADDPAQTDQPEGEGAGAEDSGSDDDEAPHLILSNHALEALRTLRLYELQQENGSHKTIELLDRHEAIMLARLRGAREPNRSAEQQLSSDEAAIQSALESWHRTSTRREEDRQQSAGAANGRQVHVGPMRSSNTVDYETPGGYGVPSYYM